MYRERLKNVRAELVSIATDLKPTADLEIHEDAGEANEAKRRERNNARAIVGICGILVRVIDAIP